MPTETKRWKPRKGQWYWYIVAPGDIDEEVNTWTWKGEWLDNHLYTNGNCFKTKELALKMAKRLKQTLLKGPHSSPQ